MSGETLADPAGGDSGGRDRRGFWSILAILYLGLVLRAMIAPSLGYGGIEVDLIEQKQALHRAITLGVHEVYTLNVANDPALAGSDWKGGYFVTYPPVIVYLRYVPGLVYSAVNRARFDLWDSSLNYYAMARTDLLQRLAATRGLTALVKSPAIVADLLISLGVYLFVRRRWGVTVGLAASAAYCLNPGIIINSAHWGQADSCWALFVALSILLVAQRRVELSWAAYVLALFTKPQAIAYGPLIFYLGVAGAPVPRVARASAVALGTLVIVWIPFIVGGTFVESVSALIRTTLGGEPFASNYALNLWWLATWGRGYEVSDLTPLIGLLPYRQAGMLAFLVVNAATLWLLYRRRSSLTPEHLFLAAAGIGLSFFIFSTELHENHMMGVIPLLAFTLGQGRAYQVLFALLSLGFLLNLVLFDSVLYAPLVALGVLPETGFRALSLLVAAINCCGLLGVAALMTRDIGRGAAGDPRALAAPLEAR